MGAVPRVLPSETASEILSWRKFLRRNHQLEIVGYFIAEELPIQVWDVSQKFSKKKTYLDIVSQKQLSCDVSTCFAGAK